jgi:hypothetical protein
MESRKFPSNLLRKQKAKVKRQLSGILIVCEAFLETKEEKDCFCSKYLASKSRQI